jgi:serine/threonine protein phosphatase PrpC
VAPPPGRRVEVSARSPFLITGCWPTERNDGRSARSSAYTLARVLGCSSDVSLHDAQAGDRYLLCSDGLTTVVSAGIIRDALSAPGDPEQAVGRLIDLANEAGGPDNIACVVADVTEPRQRAS